MSWDSEVEGEGLDEDHVCQNLDKILNDEHFLEELLQCSTIPTPIPTSAVTKLRGPLICGAAAAGTAALIAFPVLGPSSIVAITLGGAIGTWIGSKIGNSHDQVVRDADSNTNHLSSKIVTFLKMKLHYLTNYSRISSAAPVSKKK